MSREEISSSKIKLRFDSKEFIKFKIILWEKREDIKLYTGGQKYFQKPVLIWRIGEKKFAEIHK